MRVHVGIFMLGLALLPDAFAAEEESLYVRAQPAVALLSTPSAEAVIVRRLTPGDSVTVLGREAGFVNVQAGPVAGWMRETDLTAAVPPTQRVAQLETELADVRRQLSVAGNTLRNAQAELQQARQSAAAARDSGADRAAEILAERDTLKTTLAAAQAQIETLSTRLAELEMAREAAQLLAEQQPATIDRYRGRFSNQELLSAALGAVFFALLGMWLGTMRWQRRLRQRYHGLEL